MSKKADGMFLDLLEKDIDHGGVKSIQDNIFKRVAVVKSKVAKIRADQRKESLKKMLQASLNYKGNYVEQPELRDRFFLYGEEFQFFTTEKDLFKAAADQIEECLEWGTWEGRVNDIWAGKIDERGMIESVDWRSQQHDRVDCPPPEELDEDDMDDEGTCWFGIDYTCNYKLLPIEDDK